MGTLCKIASAQALAAGPVPKTGGGGGGVVSEGASPEHAMQGLLRQQNTLCTAGTVFHGRAPSVMEPSVSGADGHGKSHGHHGNFLPGPTSTRLLAALLFPGFIACAMEQASEDPQLSKPATVDLRKLLSGFQVWLYCPCHWDLALMHCTVWQDCDTSGQYCIRYHVDTWLRWGTPMSL